MLRYSTILNYTYAQRIISAARTSAYYAVAPFIGVILSIIILNKRPNILFFIALIIMLIGTRLASTKIEE
ncbi:MAG: EamA family transporter [Paludibacteraceae bacterium]|nr:EamA family transporter [Paludibacteraceae bacterium]